MKTDTLQDSLDKYRAKIAGPARNRASAYELANFAVIPLRDGIEAAVTNTAHCPVTIVIQNKDDRIQAEAEGEKEILHAPIGIGDVLLHCRKFGRVQRRSGETGIAGGDKSRRTGPDIGKRVIADIPELRSRDRVHRGAWQHAA